MPDSLQGKKSLLRDGLSKLLRRSPSPRVAQSALGPQQATTSHPSQSTQISISVPRSMSPNNAPCTSAPIPVSQAKSTTSSIQAPPVTESTARSVHSDSLPQDNAYAAIGGLPTTVAVPETRVQRAKAVGSVAWEGVKLTLRGLSASAGMCPPLKTAVSGLLTIVDLFEVCGSMYTMCW